LNALGYLLRSAARGDCCRRIFRPSAPGGPRGFDAAKTVKGRKRHSAVDTIGLPIAVQITAADVQDRDAPASILKGVLARSLFVPWLSSTAAIRATRRGGPPSLSLGSKSTWLASSPAD
jgi:hypothetical protein